MQQGFLEFFKRLLSLIGPHEWCVFLRHPGQWIGNLREVLDKFPVIACETVEGTYIA